MRLNTQQNVLLIIFLIAAIGLVYDRMFLLPQSTNAQSSIDNRKSSDKPMLVVDSVPEYTESDILFGQRLHELVLDESLDFNNLPDAFSLSLKWYKNKNQIISVEPSLITNFKEKYKLRAIIFQEDIKAVFINDKKLRIGEKAGGFELVDLNETSAIFAKDGNRIVFYLN